jgi:hypothetical protein
MYLGIAAEHLNRARFNLINDVDTATSNARVYANVIATFGKAFIVSDNLVIKTSILSRLASTAGNIDLSSSVMFKNRVQVGLTFRTTGVIVFMTEVNLSKNLRMGIAYDIDGSDVASSTSGSLEVFVGYDVGLFKSKVVSPRYF